MAGFKTPPLMLNARARLLTLLTLTGAALLSAGCGSTTRFVGHSSVDEDGALTRSGRIVRDTPTCGEVCREYLESHYELPTGGSWRVASTVLRDPHGEMTPVDVEGWTWEARYAPSEVIPGDFVRKGAAGGRARNEINLSARNFYFLKTYRYQERFRDVVTLDTLRAGTQRLAELWMDTVAHALADALGPSVSVEAARAAFGSIIQPLFDASVAGLRQHGMTFLESTEFQAIWRQSFDEDTSEPTEQTVRRIAASLAPSRPADVSDTEWFARIAAALDFDIEDSFEWLSDEEGAAVMEAIFGAHGFQLFDRFVFQLQVRLPGDVYRSNATGTADGALLWEFDSDAFVLRDYRVEARSRVVYPGRIQTAGIAMSALLVLALTWLWRRSQRQRDAIPRE